MDYLGCYAINFLSRHTAKSHLKMVSYVQKRNIMIQHDVGHNFGSKLDHVNRPKKRKSVSFSNIFLPNYCCCTQFRLLSLFFITKKQFLLCKVQTLFCDLFVVVLGQEAKHAGKFVRWISAWIWKLNLTNLREVSRGKLVQNRLRHE